MVTRIILFLLLLSFQTLSADEMYMDTYSKHLELKKNEKIKLPKQYKPEEIKFSEDAFPQIINNTPNDYYYQNSQYYWRNNTGHGIEDAYILLKHQAKHPVNIAVLDSGFYPNPDVSLFMGVNFVEDASLGVSVFNNPNCASTHGGSVTSVIGALTNNAYGMAGIIDAKLYALRVMGCDGSGQVSNIINALKYLTLKENYRPVKQYSENGVFEKNSYHDLSEVPFLSETVDVVNMSFSFRSQSCPDDLQRLINKGTSQGMIFVAAAGNENRNVKDSSPANCKNVITVGSVSKNKLKTDFSNHGNLVDVYAMGENITAAYNDMIPFASLKGTSFSAPIVSGVIGMMKSIKPDLTYEEVDALLKDNADIKDDLLILNAKKIMGKLLDKEGIELNRVTEMEGAKISKMILSLNNSGINEHFILTNNLPYTFFYFDDEGVEYTLNSQEEIILKHSNYYYFKENKKISLINLLN